MGGGLGRASLVVANLNMCGHGVVAVSMFLARDEPVNNRYHARNQAVRHDKKPQIEAQEKKRMQRRGGDRRYQYDHDKYDHAEPHETQ